MTNHSDEVSVRQAGHLVSKSVDNGVENVAILLCWGLKLGQCFGETIASWRMEDVNKTFNVKFP